MAEERKFTLDPDYHLIEAIPGTKKGSQCGECGAKFDYGIAHGYVCHNPRCPTQWRIN